MKGNLLCKPGNSTAHRALLHGFSLIEMLIVVTIVGVVAGVLVTSFSPIWAESNEATDRRNAQDLAALSASAEAFGAEIIVPGDLVASISNLVNGVTIPATQSRPAILLKVPLNDPKKITGAAQYLTLDGEVLEYHPEL